MKVQLVIPAAGMGTRLGANSPKALVPLCGRPMLVLTLERLAPLGLVDRAVVLAPPGRLDTFEAVLGEHFPDRRFSVLAGGVERQDSVGRGLAALDSDTAVVVIHDAARPFVTPDAVRASIDAASQFGAATVAIPSVDTILRADGDAFLVDTPDRRLLWACQTPQTFRVEAIRRAHASALREGYTGTDDASLVRRYGGKVKLVSGTRFNFKITTQEDLVLAEALIKEGLV